MAGELAALLARTGWLDPSVGQAPSPTGADTSPQATVEAYVRFALGPGVKATADVLRWLVTAPRCGCKDVGLEALGGIKWPHLGIRFYRAAFGLIGWTSAQVDQAYRAALDSWAAVCAVTPQIVAEQAAANVVSLSGRIDGQGQTLAYSYLPYPGITEDQQLQQLYDNAERYSTLAAVQEVIAHEVGHALGLNHLAAGALMAPYATGKVVRPQAGDIAAIQALYGPPVAPVPIPTPTPTPGMSSAVLTTPGGRQVRVTVEDA